MKNKQKIFVAGHKGMVGSSIIRALQKQGHNSGEIITRTRQQLDLIEQSAVFDFFQQERPTHVYLAAAKVGGIFANDTYPAEFIYDNLMIQLNVINSAFASGVKHLLFLGSSCIYPKLSSQPIDEASLLTGKLEPTNEPYAIAKIAGIKLCERYNRQFGESHGIDYRSVMPTNLYGPGDNYSGENSHVIPALLKRFHEAKIKNQEIVTIWGTGQPKREFLVVDDLAAACLHVMNLKKEVYDSAVCPMESHLNVGYGEEISIYDLAVKIANIVGFKGQINFDSLKPDGISRKCLNSKKLANLGWTPLISLSEGLASTYRDYVKNHGTT